MSVISRKCLILPAIAILALVYAGFFSVLSANENEGYQPAGAWAWLITIPGAPVPVPALVTLHHDGTVAVATHAMFKTPSGGTMSTGQGAWERTGPWSFGGTTLYMLYDSNGMQVGFSRARSALHFVDDPDHIEGLLYSETCISSCQDPTSPDAVWTGPGPFSVSGTRIQRVEVPE